MPSLFVGCDICVATMSQSINISQSEIIIFLSPHEIFKNLLVVRTVPILAAIDNEDSFINCLQSSGLLLRISVGDLFSAVFLFLLG